MGFFGGDDNDSSNQANDVADQQLKLNQAEIEQKKQSLYKTRLDIEKGLGGQSWTPNK